MSKYTRQYDFQPDTTIMSGQVDEELNAVKTALDDHIDKALIEHPDDSISMVKLKDEVIAGWKEAGETWTYASATTITVPAGATSIYQIGDKIKLTQTTVKYFFIIGVADTLLTITGGIDYTLVDAVITSPFYSKIENPQGFPTWFNWTPTYSASGSMTYTTVTTLLAKFHIVGKTLYFMLYCGGTTGGTASIYLIFTIPVNCADSEVSRVGGGGSVKDTDEMGGFWTNADASKINAIKYNIANFALGTDRRIRMQGFYRIA